MVDNEKFSFVLITPPWSLDGREISVKVQVDTGMVVSPPQFADTLKLDLESGRVIEVNLETSKW